MKHLWNDPFLDDIWVSINKFLYEELTKKKKKIAHSQIK